MLKVNNKDISMTPTDVVLVLLSLNLSMSSILIRLNFKEKTLSCGLILNKVESCMTATLLKETLAQVFSSENRDFFSRLLLDTYRQLLLSFASSKLSVIIHT